MRRNPDSIPIDLMRPMLVTGKLFYLFTFIGLLVVALYAYTFFAQLIQGHGITGQSTPIGAVWGLYVASIVFFIGISHVGIGVSAGARLLNLHYLKPYARIAELLTMVCLPAAVMLIAIDIGRPERFLINVMRYGRIWAPFVWSATVISVYFVASSIYLYLSLRRDIAFSAKVVPEKRRPFYKLLALGYEDTEEQRKLHDRTLWWLALILIPIMVSVHSVYGLVFGLHAGRPGWFNAFMAPYFVLGAVVNGFATLVIVAALIRWLFHWQQHLSVQGIRNLGRFLSWMTLLYIYFSVAEYITFFYSPPAAEAAVARSLFLGGFSWIFWMAMAGLASGYLMLFFNQTIFRHQFRLWVTVLGAVLIDLVLFTTRYLIVIPSLLNPLLPYPEAKYIPTLYEWAALIGVFAFAIGAYALFIKFFPIIELSHSTDSEVTER